MPVPTLALAAHLAVAPGVGPTVQDRVSLEPTEQFAMDDLSGEMLTEGHARIVRPGTFHAGELADVEAGPWMGIYRSEVGYFLAPTEVQVERFQDRHAGDGPGDSSGRSVFAVDGGQQPVFLVQGGDGWIPGAVHTAIGEAGLLHPGERVGLDRGRGDADLLIAYGSVNADDIDPSAPIYEDYRLQLVSLDDGRPVRTQELVWMEHFGLDRVPSLWFAGDLDRDGRLDLVLDIAPEEGGEQLILYLSSAAAPGELVADVASRRNGGC